MNKGSQQGIEESKGGKSHADGIHNQGSNKVLHDNAPATARHTQRLDKFSQVASNQNDIPALSGDVSA